MPNPRNTKDVVDEAREGQGGRLQVRFTYPDGMWRRADMLECPRVGEYVDAGLAGYHVASVRWEPFQQEEDNPPPDLAYDVDVRLEPGMAPQDRAKYIARKGRA